MLSKLMNFAEIIKSQSTCFAMMFNYMLTSIGDSETGSQNGSILSVSHLTGANLLLILLGTTVT